MNSYAYSQPIDVELASIPLPFKFPKVFIAKSMILGVFVQKCVCHTAFGEFFGELIVLGRSARKQNGKEKVNKQKWNRGQIRNRE